MPDIQEILNWLSTLSPEGLTVVFSLVIAYFVRRIKRFSNSWVFPACIVTGVILYLCMTWTMAAPGMNIAGNVARKMILGAVMSIIGGLAGLGLHSKAFKFLADKWPALNFLICDDDDSVSTPPSPQPPPTTP